MWVVVHCHKDNDRIISARKATSKKNYIAPQTDDRTLGLGIAYINTNFRATYPSKLQVASR
ncbi:MAG: BrnT family toxin [Helicobacter sp.]|nr:BrnT family toxin [Helicobacter sp.]